MTAREFLYRPAFELGRHLIGYEVQKILAAVDWFSIENQKPPLAQGQLKIGVIGWGEGGMLALYAGALDTRINVVCVSGYFGSRNHIWEEPIDRNVWGFLGEYWKKDSARPCVVARCASVRRAGSSWPWTPSPARRASRWPCCCGLSTKAASRPPIYSDCGRG